MSSLSWFDKRRSDRGQYASKEEFASVFESERTSLRQLALLLTANSEVAYCCLVLALRECIASSSVSKGWVLTWARRAVIRSAIRLVIGSDGQPFIQTIDDGGRRLIVFPAEDSLSPLANSQLILELPELDRFVFVICVLERYSIHDCALLLARSPRDIYEARQRTANQIGRIAEINDSSMHLAMRQPSVFAAPGAE